MLRSTWLAALLTAVVVGLAVLTGFKAYDAFDPPQEAAPESGLVVDDDTRDLLQALGVEVSQQILTYHHDSFDQDIEVASASLTPEFRADYAATMDEVRANTAKNKISQEASAVASAIISATPEEARILVFVNQETTSARTKRNRVVRSRLVVDLVRSDADGTDAEWAVAGVNALG